MREGNRPKLQRLPIGCQPQYRKGRRGLRWILSLVWMLLGPAVDAAPSSLYLRILVVPDRAQAEQLREACNTGQPFEELARDHSLDPSAQRGGYLGLVQLSRLNQQFQQAASSLKPGQVSAPFQSGGDWVLLYRMRRDFLERANQLLEQGDAALKEKRLETARDAYQRALLLYPDLPKGYFSLGVVYGLLEQLEKEKQSYRRALQLAPDFAQAYYNLGKVYAASGDPFSAMHAFRKAVEAKPDYAQALVNLSALQLATGDPAGAAASAERAVQLDPLLASAHYNLGLARAGNDLEAALESFRMAWTLDPAQLDARINAIVALARLGRVDQAREELDELRQQHPDLEPARRLQQQIDEIGAQSNAPSPPPGPASAQLKQEVQRLAAAGRFEETVKLLDSEPSSLEDPELRLLAAQARTAWGAQLDSQGRTAAARAQWRRALEMAPKFVPALLSLARVDTREGDFAAAADRLNRASQIAPDNPAVVLARADLAYQIRDFQECYRLTGSLPSDRLPTPLLLRQIALLLDLDQTSQALKIARKWVPPGAPSLQLSHLLAENALYEEAIGLLQGQDTPEARLQLAHVYLRQLRFEESEALLQQLIGTGYRPWQTRMLLGKLKMDAGDANAAVAALQEAVRLQPENVNGLYQLALACWQTGQTDAAIDWLRRARKLEPQSDRLKYELGRMLAQSGQSVEALNLLLEVVKSQPDHPRAHYALGDLYRQMGDLDASRRHLERFQQLQEQLEQDRRQLKARKAALKPRKELQP